jgi:hypothetical protein
MSVKWIVACAAVVIGVLAVLLYKVVSDDAPPATADRAVVASARDGAAVTAGTRVIADARPATADLPEGPEPAFPDDADASMDEFRVRGEEFFERVDWYSRQRLPELVADCYKGGEDRKAKLKLHYRVAIDRHKVTLRDITVVESTLKSAAVQDCMIRTLQGASFDDVNMPDFLSAENEPETVLIRIEALKRFYDHQDEGTR